MRPSSLGGGRIYCVALCLSVRLSVHLSVRPVIVFVYFTVEPSYERTSKIENLFSLMGQRHVCTFRHAQMATYRTAISAAQIFVFSFFLLFLLCLLRVCVRLCVWLSVSCWRIKIHIEMHVVIIQHAAFATHCVAHVSCIHVNRNIAITL